MRTTSPARPAAVAAAGVLAGSWLLLAAGAAVAVPCDAYSGGCPPPATDLGGGTDQPGTGGGGGGGQTDQPGTGGTDQPGAGGSGSGGSGSGGGSGRPSTLPFTGGELVTLTAVGAGAVAGGAVLVLSGRRRREPAAS